MKFPELANDYTRAYPRLITAAVRSGAWVQTPSEFIRREVLDHFPVPAERVVAVPYGVTRPDAPSPQSDAAAGRRIAGFERFVLALGTIEPRKDITALIEAFDVLGDRHATLGLVIVGQDGWGADQVARAIDRSRHSGRIVRLGHVDETARAALLRGASVLAYPSRYEGFGLPPLEAMDVGTPVVCTDAGSLPEVLGDAAHYVAAELLTEERSEGTTALADALDRVISDDTHRTELVRRGRTRSARYTWDVTAAGIAELYHAAARRSA